MGDRDRGCGQQDGTGQQDDPPAPPPVPHISVTAPWLDANPLSPPCASDAMPALQVMTS